MLWDMSEKKTRKDQYDQNKSIRVVYATEAALDRAVANLREMKSLKFRDGRVNAQAVINASWWAMEAMGPEALAAWIRPHLERLEAVLDGQDDPGYSEQVESAKPVGISKSKPNRADARPADINRPARVSRKS